MSGYPLKLEAPKANQLFYTLFTPQELQRRLSGNGSSFEDEENKTYRDNKPKPEHVITKKRHV